MIHNWIYRDLLYDGGNQLILKAEMKEKIIEEWKTSKLTKSNIGDKYLIPKKTFEKWVKRKKMGWKLYDSPFKERTSFEMVKAWEYLEANEKFSWDNFKKFEIYHKIA